MKKLLVLIVASIVVLFFACQPGSRLFETTMSDNPMMTDQGTVLAGAKSGCATIKDGTILTSTGEAVVLGYDQWGYNYQARMFNGRYCDYKRGLSGSWDAYCDVELIMKWNDAWMSNMDCNSDNLLDRHFGYTTYVGSGAWLTNHQSGTNEDGKWTYFVKIVAVPSNATLINGIWYINGREIGPTIWGQFATIQKLETGNGPPSIYKSPVGPGFGKYKAE